MIDIDVVCNFLDQERLALVGVSDRKDNFGRTVFAEMRARGIDVVPVHPRLDEIDGVACFPDVASVPRSLDGVVVMVNRDDAVDVVRDCVARQVPRVWLFKGAGPGAVSDEAVQLCRDAGIDVVAGACPMMFLEPVGFVHRAHRGIRRMRGAFRPAA